MVLINKAINEITVKLVFYGPGLCGKTTNLEKIYGNPKLEHKGKMISMSTETDRTLFFDFMPMELGTIAGQKVRCQLYTVPGQVFYDATRKLVLRGSDGVVFVADSQNSMRGSNLESLENLKTNLRLNRIDPDKVALVFQFNKRDLPGIDSVQEMNEYLNPDHLPFVEAVAKEGTGVTATLRAAITRILANIKNKVDVTLHEEAELSAPDMSVKGGLTSASAGTPKVSLSSAAGKTSATPAQGNKVDPPAHIDAPMHAPSFASDMGANPSSQSLKSRGDSLSSSTETAPFDDLESSIDSSIDYAVDAATTAGTAMQPATDPTANPFASDTAVEASAPFAGDDVKALHARAKELVRTLEGALELARQNERELAERNRTDH